MDKCGNGKLYCERYRDQALSDCQRDITGHLDMLKMRGEDVSSEKELILMRAGKDIFMPLSSASFPIGRDLFTVSFSTY